MVLKSLETQALLDTLKWNTTIHPIYNLLHTLHFVRFLFHSMWYVKTTVRLQNTSARIGCVHLSFEWSSLPASSIHRDEML
jgi:hypothetical protein